MLLFPCGHLRCVAGTIPDGSLSATLVWTLRSAARIRAARAPARDERERALDCDVRHLYRLPSLHCDSNLVGCCNVTVPLRHPT